MRRGGLEKWFDGYRRRLEQAQLRRADHLFERRVAAVKGHGVPVTLSVQARRALRPAVAVDQPSRRPGTTARGSGPTWSTAACPRAPRPPSRPW